MSSLLSRNSLSALLLATTLAAAPLTQAHADSLDQFGLHKATGEAKFVSGTGNTIFLAAGTLLPLLHRGEEGKQQSLRTVDALVASTIVAEGLKTLTKEERPDGSSRSSFPSGHTSAAFTIATMQAHYHPNQALLWYGGAALIGASRVQLDRHYWHDVLAGAAVGYFTTQLELHQGKGLILRPFIKPEDRDGRHAQVMGIGLSKTF